MNAGSRPPFVCFTVVYIGWCVVLETLQLVCLCCSDLVYPVRDRSELDSSNKELKSGKFEPLAHMNGLLKQEVNRVISLG